MTARQMRDHGHNGARCWTRQGEGQRCALTRRRVVAGALGVAGAASVGAGLTRSESGFTRLVAGVAAQSGATLCEPVVWESANGLLSVELVATEDFEREGGGLAYAGGGVVCPGGGVGFSGRVPGPTLRVFPGDRLRIKLRNRLPGEHNTTNLHVHGLHVSPLGNGDNVFVHVMPESEFDFEYDIPPDHPTGLFWYHPHYHTLAESQVDKGLAGAIIIAEGPGEQAAVRRRLVPSGARYPGPVVAKERLLVFQRLPGIAAPFLVNGQENPVIEIREGEQQRWQLLNASAKHFVNLAVEGHRLTRVAVDGNWIPNYRDFDPLQVVALGPAERAEVLITGAAAGAVTDFQVLSLKTSNGRNRPLVDWDLEQDCLTLAAPDVLATLRIVEGAAPPPEADPEPVAPVPCNASSSLPPRLIAFTPTLMIDGKAFSEGRVDQTVDYDTTEIWKIVNQHSPQSGWHPFHLHVNDFDVLRTSDPRLERAFYQDTIPLPPARAPDAPCQPDLGEACESIGASGLCQGWVEICSRFADFTGKFVYHCHFLDHEDVGMMGVVEVVKPVTITAAAFDPSSLSLPVGATVVWTNADDAAYAIAADDGSFNSGSLGQHQSFAYTFEAPGTVTYRCIAAEHDAARVSCPPGLEGVVDVASIRTVDITAGASPGTIAFHPPTLQFPPIIAGTTVVWTNRDSVPHSITGADGSFASGPVPPGGTFAQTFPEPVLIAYEAESPAQQQAVIDVRPRRPVATVRITNDGFIPDTLDIQPGTLVMWINQANDVRTVTADHTPQADPEFDSGILDPPAPRDPDDPAGSTIPGQRFSHRFERLGIVTYHSLGEVAPPPAGQVNVVTLVEIVDSAFIPNSIEIPAGTPVSWVNRGSLPHTVTAVDTGFAGAPEYTSDALAHGDRFTRSFATPGEYTYRCAIHTGMTGTVIVR